MTSSAVLSPCGQYRYRLERTVAMEGPVYAFFGINPSTADHVIDDQTVKKWIGFTKVWGGGRFIVGNVFAFRATDVTELTRAHDAIGPDNAAHLAQIIADADVLVPCWGRKTKAPKRLRGELDLLLMQLVCSGKPVMHLGLTQCGQPTHPQMLGYATKLRPWGQP
jgi:hypothetical protein